MENEVRKLDSPWWNSKICAENSEWIAENVKGFDQCVKEMLLLVERDGDFSVEKPHSNHPMEPELIARIKEISHWHHLLVDHYNKLTGEMKDYEKTAFGPQLTHPFLTPEKKLGMQNVESQVVCSELSLSSGGGISDTTPIEGSESSLLSSDSDSESYNSSPCENSSLLPSENMLKHEKEYEMLMRRILDYEKELKVSKEKFLFAEEEIARLKSQVENNEAFISKMGSIEAQLLSAENQIKLHEAEIENENKRSLMLHRQIVKLEAKLESEKRQVEELQESVKNRDLGIEKLNGELQDASANFALEKWQLESSVFNLSERLSFHEARANELRKQCESFEAEKVGMVRKQEALKLELHEKNVIVDTLNENLDELKLNYHMIMAEKDGVNAKLQTLSADLSVRNDQILSLELRLNEFQSENERLSEGSDSANKVIAELKSRIDELEKEVGMQKVMISDTAEEKREAIRQLCFSLDHFRSAYQELRDVYAISKRPTAMAS